LKRKVDELEINIRAKSFFTLIEIFLYSFIVKQFCGEITETQGGLPTLRNFILNLVEVD
jgi:hypothetical protein